MRVGTTAISQFADGGYVTGTFDRADCEVDAEFARNGPEPLTVGVLWPQSHLFRHTGRNWGQARPEHRCADQKFRDQLLVFLEGALGVRQGELGALRWLECDFDNMSISVQHSYYWRRGVNLKSTKTEASAKLLPMHPSLKHSLQEWRSQSLYNKPEDFVFPSEKLRGCKPLDLASVLKKKIQPAFRRIGITGVVWHTFRHSVGTMLAEMGEHQLTIRDYLRHSNLHVTNKYLQATSRTKRLAQDKLVDAILPTGILPKTNLIQ